MLPGATVTVTSSDTGYTRSVVTNAEGLYTIPLLPPGSYELAAELTGFSPTRRNLVLNVGATQTINAQLQVGGVQETVTVAAGSPLVETSATVRTTTVDLEAIANLPINGRRFQDFISATPTVQVDPSRGQLSFAGQRGINSNISVDGADFNQPFFGGIRGGERSNNAFTVPQESIQEFQVVAAGYSAEFGRSTGGLVNAITKSGSNRLKGSAFYVNRNRDWAEDNAFGQSAAPTQQQFGGSVGGPISQGQALLLRRLRAAGVREHAAGALRSAGRLHAGRRPARRPSTTTSPSKSRLTRPTTPSRRWAGVDWQLGEADRLSVRYSYSSNKALNANATGNALDPNTISALTNNGTEKDRTNIVVGQYTSAFTSSMLFEARGQYGYEERPREANFEGTSVQSAIGNYGTVSFLPNKQFDRRTQLAANLTWLSGTHSFKGGVEYNRVFADQTFGFNQFGRFIVNGTEHGDAARHLQRRRRPSPTASIRADVVYQRQIGNLRLEFPTQEIAFYAQDNWKVRPEPHDQLRRALGRRGQPDARGQQRLHAQRPQRRDVPEPAARRSTRRRFRTSGISGARASASPGTSANDGRTVVRGYTGIYYARSPALLYAAPMNNFRVPAGDLSPQLPFAVPASNPNAANNTVYKQLQAHRHRSQQLPAGHPARSSRPSSSRRLAPRSASAPNPFNQAQPLDHGQGLQEPARDAVRRRHRARVRDG